MGTTTWIPGVSADRRAGGDRRVPSSILCQEALARIVAETRGDDSYAGRALKELARRRAEATEPASGDDELIIYSLRGRWLVGTVREIRAEMVAAAAAACRRRSAAAADESLPPGLIERRAAEQLPPEMGLPR